MVKKSEIKDKPYRVWFKDGSAMLVAAPNDEIAKSEATVRAVTNQGKRPKERAERRRWINATLVTECECLFED